jgi:diguanylate cyclase (GGDEF)-like protein
MQDANSKIYSLGFFFLFLVFAASSYHSYDLFSKSRENLNDATLNNDLQLSSVLKMRVAVRERAIILWHMTLEEDFFDRDELFEKFYHYGAEYKKAREQFLNLDNSSDEASLFKALDLETTARAPVLRAFADRLMVEGDEDYTDELNGTLTDQIVVAQILDKLIALQQHQNNLARKSSEKEIEDILSNQIQIMILIFFFGFIFAGFVINSSVRQRKELELANKKLEIQASHDSLTGLVNRGYLLKQLEMLLANVQRHKRNGAVMFIDLDDFKPINDNYGHRVGDQYLKLLSDEMLKVIRQTDILSRLGGDEFILVLTDLESKEDSLIVAEKLLETLSNEYVINNLILQTSASIGIYQLNDAQVSAEEAIILADQAMYKAKKSGKNQYSLI